MTHQLLGADQSVPIVVRLLAQRVEKCLSKSSVPPARILARQLISTRGRQELHNTSPERMLVTDLDGGGMSEIVADFGASGLWVRYNDATWMKLHNASTQDLAAGGFD